MDFAQKLIVWLPRFFNYLIFILAVWFYFKRSSFKNAAGKFKMLFGLALAFRILEATTKTILQYFIWQGDNLTRKFFEVKPNYFFTYSFSRFWLNLFVSLGIAIIFYFFLRALQAHTPRFFEEGEIELGLLAAFLAGWPQFVIFLPLTFLLVLILSVLRTVFLKQLYTTLGAPFLLSLLILLIFGEKLSQVFHLVILKI